MDKHRPDINISADEINALIHSYLVDSGWLPMRHLYWNVTVGLMEFVSRLYSFSFCFAGRSKPRQIAFGNHALSSRSTYRAPCKVFALY